MNILLYKDRTTGSHMLILDENICIPLSKSKLDELFRKAEWELCDKGGCGDYYKPVDLPKVDLSQTSNIKNLNCCTNNKTLTP